MDGKHVPCCKLSISSSTAVQDDRPSIPGLNAARIVEVFSSEYYREIDLTEFFVLSNVSPNLMERTIRFVQGRYESSPHLKRIRGRSILLTPRIEDQLVDEFSDAFMLALGKEDLVTTTDLKIEVVKVPQNPVLTISQYKRANSIWPVRVTTPLVDETAVVDGSEREIVLDNFKRLVECVTDFHRGACMFRSPVEGESEGIGIDTSRDLHVHYKHAVFEASGLVGKISPYLATDYSVYALGEPCIMCSMALLHSRVGRVYYIASGDDSIWGGLGSVLSIHCNKKLNHRFRVFRVQI